MDIFLTFRAELRANFEGANPETGLRPGSFLPLDLYLSGVIEQQLLNRLYFSMTVYKHTKQLGTFQVNVDEPLVYSGADMLITHKLDYSLLHIDEYGYYTVELDLEQFYNQIRRSLNHKENPRTRKALTKVRLNTDFIIELIERIYDFIIEEIKKEKHEFN